MTYIDLSTSDGKETPRLVFPASTPTPHPEKSNRSAAGDCYWPGMWTNSAREQFSCIFDQEGSDGSNWGTVDHSIPPNGYVWYFRRMFITGNAGQKQFLNPVITRKIRNFTGLVYFMKLLLANWKMTKTVEKKKQNSVGAAFEAFPTVL